MLPEPGIACPNGHLACTLGQGASQGMHCRVCGAGLERMDEAWLAGGGRRQATRGKQPRQGVEPGVAELQLPAHNEVDEEEIGQFITALPLPLSLELFGAGSRRVMLVRGPDSSLLHLAGLIQAHWPSAMLRTLEDDQVHCGRHAANGALRFDFAFGFEKEPYLPIRTWVSFLHGDPMHNLLAATQGLEEDERVWLQVLLVRKAVPPWLSAVQQRLKIEAQRGFTVNESGSMATLAPTYTHTPVPQVELPRSGGQVTARAAPAPPAISHVLNDYTSLTADAPGCMMPLDSPPASALSRAHGRGFV